MLARRAGEAFLSLARRANGFAATRLQLVAHVLGLAPLTREPLERMQSFLDGQANDLDFGRVVRPETESLRASSPILRPVRHAWAGEQLESVFSRPGAPGNAHQQQAEFCGV
jgi:hypothetical protein